MHAQAGSLYHKFFNSLLSGTMESSILPGNDVVKQSHLDHFGNWGHVIHMYNPANNPFVAVPHMIAMAYSSHNDSIWPHFNLIMRLTTVGVCVYCPGGMKEPMCRSMVVARYGS